MARRLIGEGQAGEEDRPKATQLPENRDDGHFYAKGEVNGIQYEIGLCYAPKKEGAYGVYLPQLDLYSREAIDRNLILNPIVFGSDELKSKDRAFEWARAVEEFIKDKCQNITSVYDLASAIEEKIKNLSVHNFAQMEEERRLGRAQKKAQKDAREES